VEEVKVAEEAEVALAVVVAAAGQDAHLLSVVEALPNQPVPPAMEEVHRVPSLPDNRLQDVYQEEEHEIKCMVRVNTAAVILV